MNNNTERPFMYDIPSDDDVSVMFMSSAYRVNYAFRTGNTQAAIYYMNLLFKDSAGRDGYQLLKLNDVALQPVGFAFTYIARYLDFNDRDLNSVAAENAVYCLGKSLIANNNTFCAPALFTLFLNYSDLLNDKFFATYLYHVYWGIGIKEIPFHRRLPILLYLYSFFYDEQKQIYTVSSNVPFHFPTDENLREFQNLKKQIGASNEELYSEGENCFFRIFEECQSALYNMKNM